MLDRVDLETRIPKAEYKRRLPALQRRLFELQRGCWRHEVGVLVVFEGWDTAGKAQVLSKLTERLEPRAFELHSIHKPRTTQKELPWMHRFWMRLPAYGQMALFDYSWYSRVFIDRIDGRLSKKALKRRLRDIKSFEAALVADRYEVVKLFLHISKEEKKRRLDALSEDPLRQWRYRGERPRHHERYDDYAALIDKVLAATHDEQTPWTVVPATDRHVARLRVFETLIDHLERRLAMRGFETPAPASEAEGG